MFYELGSRTEFGIGLWVRDRLGGDQEVLKLRGTPTGGERRSFEERVQYPRQENKDSEDDGREKSALRRG